MDDQDLLGGAPADLPAGVSDFLALQPVLPVGPDTLGLPPPPMPPTEPPVIGPRGNKTADLMAVALAAFMGPGKGTGILQGLQATKMQAERERQRLAQQHQQVYQQRQRLFQWEQQQYEQEAQRRQQTLEQNVKALQASLPTLKTKADYDRTLDTFASGLQAMGLRIDGNYLRSRVPYVAPSGVATAQAAIERWRKNPQNEQLLKEHPEQAALAKIPIDRDGDGTPEMVLLDEVMTLAGMPFTKDANQIVWADKGTTQSDKANADGIYADLLAKDKAEGKAATPERSIELRKQAMRQAKEAADIGPDPTLQAIRELTLEQKRNPQAAGPSPQQIFGMEERLARAWSDATKSSREMQRQFQLMQTGLKRFRAGDPNGGSQAVLVTFQKILDPTSVVRESEYARTATGQSLLNRMEGFADQLAQGGAGMTDRELAAMVETARQFLTDMQASSKGLRRRLETQIGRYKLDPAAVFDDVLIGAPEPTAPSVAPGSGMPGLSYQDYLQRKQGAR